MIRKWTVKNDPQKVYILRKCKNAQDFEQQLKVLLRHCDVNWEKYEGKDILGIRVSNHGPNGCRMGDKKNFGLFWPAVLSIYFCTWIIFLIKPSNLRYP